MSSHSSTPAQSSKSSKAKSSKPSKSTKPSSLLFTPMMQDAQARNKDPYDVESSDSSLEEGNRRFDDYGNDSYENIQKRREAAIVLDNPELLMMHAQARNDSIPGTRNYFTKMLCGYLEEDDPYERAAEKEVEKRTLKALKGPRRTEP